MTVAPGIAAGYDPTAVVAYWRAAGRSRWFASSAVFDAQVRLRLGAAHAAAAAAGVPEALDDPTEALATLILLDQVPRNIFRGTARAFATDALAREVSRMALARGLDRRVPRQLRQFFYLPLMHSEALADQDRCVELFRVLGSPDNLRYAEIHRDVIRRFGRFPHRNAFLGRAATPEEDRYLAEGGFRA